MSTALKTISDLCTAYLTADLATKSDIRENVISRQGTIFNAKVTSIAYEAINEGTIKAGEYTKAKSDFLHFWFRESPNRSLDKSDWYPAYDKLNQIFGSVYMGAITNRMRGVVIGDATLKGGYKKLTRTAFKQFAFQRGFIKDIPKDSILSQALSELFYTPSTSLELIIKALGGTFEKDASPYQRKNQKEAKVAEYKSQKRAERDARRDEKRKKEAAKDEPKQEDSWEIPLAKDNPKVVNVSDEVNMSLVDKKTTVELFNKYSTMIQDVLVPLHHLYITGKHVEDPVSLLTFVGIVHYYASKMFATYHDGHKGHQDLITLGILRVLKAMSLVDSHDIVRAAEMSDKASMPDLNATTTTDSQEESKTEEVVGVVVDDTSKSTDGTVLYGSTRSEAIATVGLDEVYATFKPHPTWAALAASIKYENQCDWRNMRRWRRYEFEDLCNTEAVKSFVGYLIAQPRMDTSKYVCDRLEWAYLGHKDGKMIDIQNRITCLLDAQACINQTGVTAYDYQKTEGCYEYSFAKLEIERNFPHKAKELIKESETQNDPIQWLHNYRIEHEKEKVVDDGIFRRVKDIFGKLSLPYQDSEIMKMFKSKTSDITSFLQDTHLIKWITAVIQSNAMEKMLTLVTSGAFVYVIQYFAPARYEGKITDWIKMLTMAMLGTKMLMDATSVSKLFLTELLPSLFDGDLGRIKMASMATPDQLMGAIAGALESYTPHSRAKVLHLWDPSHTVEEIEEWDTVLMAMKEKEMVDALFKLALANKNTHFQWVQTVTLTRYRDLVAVELSTAKLRPQCYCLGICGKAGVGKSSIIQYAVATLCQPLGIPPVDQYVDGEIIKAPPVPTAVDPGQKFFDNINDTQMVHFWDDMGQAVVGSEGSPAHYEFIKAHGNMPAWVTGAFKKYASRWNSKLSIITANDSNFGAYGAVTSPEAFLRRISTIMRVDGRSVTIENIILGTTERSTVTYSAETYAPRKANGYCRTCVEVNDECQACVVNTTCEKCTPLARCDTCAIRHAMRAAIRDLAQYAASWKKYQEEHLSRSTKRASICQRCYNIKDSCVCKVKCDCTSFCIHDKLLKHVDPRLVAAIDSAQKLAKSPMMIFSRYKSWWSVPVAVLEDAAIFAASMINPHMFWLCYSFRIGTETANWGLPEGSWVTLALQYGATVLLGAATILNVPNLFYWQCLLSAYHILNNFMWFSPTLLKRYSLFKMIYPRKNIMNFLYRDIKYDLWGGHSEYAVSTNPELDSIAELKMNIMLFMAMLGVAAFYSRYTNVVRGKEVSDELELTISTPGYSSGPKTVTSTVDTWDSYIKTSPKLIEGQISERMIGKNLVKIIYIQGEILVTGRGTIINKHLLTAIHVLKAGGISSKGTIYVMPHDFTVKREEFYKAHTEKWSKHKTPPYLARIEINQSLDHEPNFIRDEVNDIVWIPYARRARVYQVIKNFTPRKGDVFMIDAPQLEASASSNPTVKSQTCAVTHSFTGYTQNGKFVDWDTLHYELNMKVSHGSSGAGVWLVATILNGACRPIKPVLIGMVTVANEDTHLAVFTPLTHVPDVLPPPVINMCHLENMEKQFEIHLLTQSHEKSVISKIPQIRGEYIGSIPHTIKNTRVRLQKTKHFDTLCELQPKLKRYVVPKINPTVIDGKWSHPLLATLRKRTFAKNIVDDRSLDQAVDITVDWITSGINLDVIQPLTTFQVLNGTDGIRSMNKSAGAGFPLRGTKANYIKLVDDKMYLNDEGEKVIRRALEMLDDPDEEVFPVNIATALSKVEAVDQDKEYAPRTFYGGNFPFYFFLKMYLAPICDQITMNRAHLPPQIGINAAGPELMERFKRMLINVGAPITGKNLGDTDYKWYDMLLQIINKTCDALYKMHKKAKFYQDEANAKHLWRLRKLLRQCGSFIVQFGDDFISYVDGMLSGLYMTAHINSLAAMILDIVFFCYAYAAAHEIHDYNFVKITDDTIGVRKHLDLSVFGDDVVRALSEYAKLWYTTPRLLHAAEAYGMTITPAGDDDNIELKSFESILFLKRHIRNHPDITFPNGSSYVGVLDITSIYKSLAFVEGEVEDWEYHVLDNMFRELTLHGEAEFNKLATKFKPPQTYAKYVNDISTGLDIRFIPCDEDLTEMMEPVAIYDTVAAYHVSREEFCNHDNMVSTDDWDDKSSINGTDDLADIRAMHTEEIFSTLIHNDPKWWYEQMELAQNPFKIDMNELAVIRGEVQRVQPPQEIQRLQIWIQRIQHAIQGVWPSESPKYKRISPDRRSWPGLPLGIYRYNHMTHMNTRLSNARYVYRPERSYNYMLFRLAKYQLRVDKEYHPFFAKVWFKMDQPEFGLICIDIDPEYILLWQMRTETHVVMIYKSKTSSEIKIIKALLYGDDFLNF